jgi:hypothetical protein
MKAMILGFVAIAALGYGAWWVLNSELDYSSADQGSGDNVRLD